MAQCRPKLMSLETITVVRGVYSVMISSGVILDVEEHNIKVKCMHRNGMNKFYWPGPREDVNWHDDSQIVCFISEPRPINQRSVEIDPIMWTYLESVCLLHVMEF